MSAFGPVRRLAPRSIPSFQVSRPVTKRFLNIETAPILATSHAKVTGARNGHIDAEGFQMDLTMPKSLGGAGKPGTSNPEELFAAGYGACFQSAMNVSAPMVGVKMPSKLEDSIIETDVHLIGDMKQADLGIRVDMRVKVNGLSKEDVQKVVEKTKEICPYSKATKGNVITNVEVL